MKNQILLKQKDLLMRKLEISMYTILSIMALTTNIIKAHIITTYLEQPPYEVIQSIRKEYLNNKIPGKLRSFGRQLPVQLAQKSLKRSLKLDLPRLSGFIALYQGYVDYSNKDGQITLPLKHSEQKITLVLSPSINMKKTFGVTISHVELILPEHPVKVKMYTLERKKDKNDVTFWNIKETSLPKDKKLGPEALVLLTKPQNIFVPLGDIIATESPNFILPSFYVVGDIEKKQSMFDFLDIKRFFETVATETKDEKLVKQQLIINE